MEASPAVLSGWPGVSCCSSRAQCLQVWRGVDSHRPGPRGAAGGEAGEHCVHCTVLCDIRRLLNRADLRVPQKHRVPGQVGSPPWASAPFCLL